jgi:hypothetical protein
MLEKEIHEFARQLFAARGSRVVAGAAQKRAPAIKMATSDGTATWSRIEAGSSCSAQVHQQAQHCK